MACSLFLFGCTDAGSDSEPADDSGGVITISPDIQSDNPIAQRSEIFGQDGNLWKPRSDDHASGAGNLVVLLSSKYRTQFETCEVELSNGERRDLTCVNDQPWTHIPYSCFSNGARQTWRANFQCHQAKSVRVVCRDALQEVTFKAPTGQQSQVCSRFG
ncbi:MAG: hypothetical protein KDD60_02420 [Bdellovibrionales bacterium]|nr:hypothetical protein [Bdellovibrionales bacterium]